jgi:hypothetical protein
MAGPLLTTNVVSAKKKAATPRKAAKQVVKKATTVDIGKAAYLFT